MGAPETDAATEKDDKSVPSQPAAAKGDLVEGPPDAPGAHGDIPAAPYALKSAEDGGARKKRKKKETEVAVHLRQVTKRFGVKTAVDGLTLTIPVGKVYGLIGPNGAGK